MCMILDKTDQLALLGAALENEDLLDVITEGLGEDYRDIVEMVNGRDAPITLDELHEKLINRELALNLMEAYIAYVPVTANTVQFRNQINRGGFLSSRGGSSNSRGSFCPSRPYLGKCQICGVQGHGAKHCPQYQQATCSSQFYPHGASPYRGPTPWLAPHLPLPPPQWHTQVHHTTTSSPDLSPWLLDSGTSHHIASDLSNLSLHTPYNGSDNELIINGSGLPISHTGEGSQHGDNTTPRQGQ
ncbi:Retrovirus-related Pol polyprotein from transposon RE2 [Cardamine amara subsp. amara]|uniref:Retrovirus-related Pol polyprotein from transposon RE2 n=1 Tax=Cardamine amara subsp. amara TaxID=228776 RepID=A0ABD1BBK1_CARAN